MKDKLFYPILGGLIVTLVGGWLLYVYFQKAPDVRFTLSPPVPARFLSPTGEPASVQQLEVTNRGSAKSENIRIRIMGPVETYEVDQYSNNDEVKTLSRNEGFDLTYPALPPQASFRLVVKAKGFNVDSSNLRVSDDAGPAKTALAGNSQPASVIQSIITTCVVILPAWILSILAILTNLKELDLRNLEPKTLLETKRSLYIRPKKWSRIYRDALLYRVAHDYKYRYTLEFSSSYKILGSARPDSISDADWEVVIESASARFKHLFIENLPTCRHFADLSETAAIRPVRVMESDRKEIEEAIDEHFLYLARHTYDNAKKIEILRSGKPAYVSDKAWSEGEEIMSSDLCTSFGHDITMSENPIKKLGSLNTAVLKENHKQELAIKAFSSQYDSYRSIRTLSTAEEFLKTEMPTGFNPDRYDELKSKALKIIEENTPKVGTTDSAQENLN